MALNIARQITRCKPRCVWSTNSASKFSSLWEPDYLEIGKPKQPMCPVLNVQIRGHDFPILENYQSQIHSIADRMDFDIEDSWAYPAKVEQIHRYKPGTLALDASYQLYTYERNIQLSNVACKIAPSFVRILEACLPEGITMKVDIYDIELGKKRYIPDKELLDLKAVLEVPRGEKK